MTTLAETALKELGLSPEQYSGTKKRDLWFLLFGSEGRTNPVPALGEALLHCAYYGIMDAAKWVVAEGASINFVDPNTGMNALHIAVGRNHLDMALYLVEKGIAFVPDNQGRMPTTIAAECEVSDEMCDFIVEA